MNGWPPDPLAIAVEVAQDIEPGTRSVVIAWTFDHGTQRATSELRRA